MASLEDSVKRRADPQRAFPTSEELWQKDVGCRRIGYNGEEQSICHELTWEQVLPALPPKEHGGCIDCLLWVSPRTREFLTHPEWLLKREEEVNLPKMPGKIHVRKADKMRIALELVARNVCDWIPLSKVHEINGVKVLNGLFGVAKPVLLDNGTTGIGINHEFNWFKCYTTSDGRWLQWFTKHYSMAKCGSRLGRRGEVAPI